MNAIEISVNGRRQSLAGLREGIVDATVQFTGKGEKKELQFVQVTGFDSQRNEHVVWMKRDGLTVGDEVLLRLVDAPKTDSPKGRMKPTDRRKGQEALVHRMAKELGWKIQKK